MWLLLWRTCISCLTCVRSGFVSGITWPWALPGWTYFYHYFWGVAPFGEIELFSWRLSQDPTLSCVPSHSGFWAQITCVTEMLIHVLSGDPFLATFSFFLAARYIHLCFQHRNRLLKQHNFAWLSTHKSDNTLQFYWGSTMERFHDPALYICWHQGPNSQPHVHKAGRGH